MRLDKNAIRFMTLALAELLGGQMAVSAPANTLRELNSVLNKCIKAPAAVVGSEITIAFSLKRDGSLLGSPRITFAKLPGDEAGQRDFVKAVLAAIGNCLPVSVSYGLGAAVAGRPIRLRIGIRRPQTPV